MKRFSAYATTVLTASLLALAGCTGRNDNTDQNAAQPGASTPASPASAPATTPPPPAQTSPSSSTLPPASHTSPNPAPATTAAH
ncbi:hypothetical protein ABZR86_03040 [Dyella marensis]|uniref:Uncharacterized protein n=1 Tax=Dyella marensis TaxID=500610 RepID=A0A1I1ZNA0_9GAMM|nr:MULTISPECIES: hypothetical protein [Dyella]SFE33125.1 hypothetical protein SAMN02799615_00767 [Dyella marensis]